MTSNTHKIVIQTTSSLTNYGLILLSNGNSFISYTNDSCWIKNSNTGTEVLGSTTGTQTIIFPKLSSAPSSPLVGAVYYNTITNKLQAYDGTNWNNLW